MRLLGLITIAAALTAPFAVCPMAIALDAPMPSPSWSEASSPEPQSVFHVTRYLELGSNSNLVILSAGRPQGIVVGTTFKAYRASTTGGTIWVETGRLKAVEVQNEFTIASVESQGSALAKALFPKFPEVMAGDLAVSQTVSLSRRQMVLPTLTLSYFDLFEDPKGSPTSFELKSQGLERLKQAAKEFAEARVSLLMVEGYTDHNGPSSANQVESQQRAQTVRQYLIDELGFDPQRVVAIGYGAAEPTNGSFVPGYVQANRRIVLKAVAMPEGVSD